MSELQNDLNNIAELEVWSHKPDKFQGYVCGDEFKTFMGSVLGRVVRRSVHVSNFGWNTKIESVTIKGTNGELYHGRHSNDWEYCRVTKRKTTRMQYTPGKIYRHSLVSA